MFASAPQVSCRGAIPRMTLAIAIILWTFNFQIHPVQSQQTTALAALRLRYPNLPYQADPNEGTRGRQVGYNLCNSTTEGQTSLCQTSFINSIEDFCLWGPPEPSIVADTEGEMVAWCTKPGKGTRQIPAGALQGVQFMKTPHYVQVTGYINQPQINIQEGDDGGELDPHGADNRGNPLGGLMFSNSFGPLAANGTFQATEFKQVIEWTNFMGAGQFCLKACDPSYEYASRMCEHIYDRIGCRYNAPAAYVNGTFETCLGDDQLFPGVYVENGQTLTYTQPPESLGVINAVPYSPFIPASSSCTPYESAALYSAAAPTTPTSTTSTMKTSITTTATSLQPSRGASSSTTEILSSSPRTSSGPAMTQAASSGVKLIGGHQSSYGILTLVTLIALAVGWSINKIV